MRQEALPFNSSLQCVEAPLVRMDAEALVVELQGTGVDSQLKALEKLRKVAKQGDEARTEICDVGGLERLKSVSMGGTMRNGKYPFSPAGCGLHGHALQ